MIISKSITPNFPRRLWQNRFEIKINKTLVTFSGLQLGDQEQWVKNLRILCDCYQKKSEKTEVTKSEQVEDPTTQKDEMIAQLLEDKKQLTLSNQQLLDEIKTEKNYSAQLLAEKNKLEKENDPTLISTLKAQISSLENKISELESSVNKLTQEKEEAQRKSEEFGKILEKIRSERAGRSAEMENLKNENTQQTQLLNQQSAEIEKLRNELAHKEKELEDKDAYIKTILPEMEKEEEEHNQLRKQLEAIRDAQEKLSEEKKNSLAKNNKIVDLELAIKDAGVAVTTAEAKAAVAEEELSELKKERETEKEEFISSVNSLKMALDLLIGALSGANAEDQPQPNEEELIATMKSSLQKIPELDFLADVFKTIRDKIKQGEQRIKLLESQASSSSLPEADQIAKLKNELTDSQKEIQNLNMQVVALEKEKTEKTKEILDKTSEFGLQFSILVKELFSSDQKSSLTQIDTIIEQYPQLKSIQEVYGFLQDTVKKDLDQAKAALQAKTNEMQENQEQLAASNKSSENAEEIEQLKAQIKTLSAQVEEYEKIIKEKGSSEVKEATKDDDDLETSIKDRGQVMSKLRSEITKLEEFTSTYLFLLKEPYSPKKMPPVETKKKEEMLKSLAQGNLRMEELVGALTWIEDQRQKEKLSYAANLKDTKAENEKLMKELKFLGKVASTLKAEYEDLKQRYQQQTEYCNEMELALQTKIRRLIKIEEFNHHLYAAIRQIYGEEVNTTEFFKSQDRNARLKQLSDGISELRILVELYDFVNNSKGGQSYHQQKSPSRTALTPQRNILESPQRISKKESSPDLSHRPPEGTIPKTSYLRDISQGFISGSPFKSNVSSHSKLHMDVKDQKMFGVDIRESLPTSQKSDSPSKPRIQNVVSMKTASSAIHRKNNSVDLNSMAKTAGFQSRK